MSATRLKNVERGPCLPLLLLSTVCKHLELRRPAAGLLSSSVPSVDGLFSFPSINAKSLHS